MLRPIGLGPARDLEIVGDPPVDVALQDGHKDHRHKRADCSAKGRRDRAAFLAPEIQVRQLQHRDGDQHDVSVSTRSCVIATSGAENMMKISATPIPTTPSAATAVIRLPE
jgi:hypothetical protein